MYLGKLFTQIELVHFRKRNSKIFTCRCRDSVDYDELIPSTTVGTDLNFIFVTLALELTKHSTCEVSQGSLKHYDLC